MAFRSKLSRREDISDEFCDDVGFDDKIASELHGWYFAILRVLVKTTQRSYRIKLQVPIWFVLQVDLNFFIIGIRLGQRQSGASGKWTSDINSPHSWATLIIGVKFDRSRRCNFRRHCIELSRQL